MPTRKAKRARNTRGTLRSHHHEDSHRSAFLELPPAIRVRIYEYLFHHESHRGFPQTLRSLGRRVRPAIGLLRSCQMIYDEAITVLYGENNFPLKMCISNHSLIMDNFLRQLGPESRAALRRIRLETQKCYGNHNARAPQMHYHTIEVLELLQLQWTNPFCEVRIIEPQPRDKPYETYISRSDVERVMATMKVLCAEPVIRRYSELKLLSSLRIYVDGLSGVMVFRSTNRYNVVEQKFQIRAPPTAYAIKQEPDATEVIVIKEEDDEVGIEEQVFFQERRGRFTRLPDPVIVRILEMALDPPKTIYISTAASTQTSERSPQDESDGEGDFSLSQTSERSSQDESDGEGDFPLSQTLFNVWGSKKLRDWADRLSYLQNTISFRYEWPSAQIGQTFSCPVDVREWLGENPQRQFAKRIDVTFSFTSISLEHIRMNLKHLLTPASGGLLETSIRLEPCLNILLRFLDDKSEHTVSMHDVERSINAFRAKRMWTDGDIRGFKRCRDDFDYPSLSHRGYDQYNDDFHYPLCLVDGYGRARAFDKREHYFRWERCSEWPEEMPSSEE